MKLRGSCHTVVPWSLPRPTPALAPFVQGTIKRIVDTGAADLRGQADTRTAAANRSRYFKEAERLLAKGPAEDPEVQEAKAQLRQQAHERQRVEERREEQEAIERVKRQVEERVLRVVPCSQTAV